jgi:hypothetical protein
VENNKIIRKRLLTFLVFVLISSAFWVYRALDDIYTTSVKYPVNYINLPSNKVLAGNPPREISINLKGNGYTILRNIIKPPVLDLNVNDFSLYSQSKDSLNVYFISRFAFEWFKNEINSENRSPVEIISIKPDTITFNFTRSYAKKIPVKLIFNDEKHVFARQHMLNGKILIVPDSILVSGPANYIDTMKYVYTEALDISEIKDTITKKLDIIEYMAVNYSSVKVKITIPVDRFTESMIEVPVSVKNAPDSILIKVFPRTVKVTYKVTLTMYNLVSEADFAPYVDYSNVNNQNSISNPRLNVYLDSIPIYTHSVSIYPQDVEYLIELNNDKNWLNRGNR